MTIYTVTTLADTHTAGKLTLREAVARAGDGDTIEFASGLAGGVSLTKNLSIAKSITIDGSEGRYFALGGALSIGGYDASVVVKGGGTVTLEHLGIVGGAPGASGTTPGTTGEEGTGGDSGTHGGDGSDGDNGGKGLTAGSFGSPALINEGTLTLDHVNVSGNTGGGNGSAGGDGGAGGSGGGGNVQAGDGGQGGNGGLGAHGGSAVAGIQNLGSLTLKDSVVAQCSADGGDGGDGGAGGDGGQGGQGGTGGVGGAGGNGGNGGSGGAAIGGILNEGSVKVVGAALFYGNTATGGAGGAAGALGNGGLAGSYGGGETNGRTGQDGSAGKTGSTGSAIDNIDGAGPTSGHFTVGDHFFELYAGATLTGGQSIGAAGFGGSSYSGVSATVLKEGNDGTAGSVAWKVVGIGGDVKAADFTGGKIPSGVLNFGEDVDQAVLNFSFASGFVPPKNEQFKIQLSSPSSGDVLGSGTVFTENLYLATKGNDTITGSAGVNNIDGGAGNDRLTGGISNDNLSGSAGNDVLKGGDGNDQLTGGAGADTLFGGAGADVFNFFSGDSTPTVADTIRDFSHAQGDRISIVLAQSFIGTKAFDGHAGEIRYFQDAKAGTTTVQFDSNGDKKVDTQISLTHAMTLVASDFGLS